MYLPIMMGPDQSTAASSSERSSIGSVHTPLPFADKAPVVMEIFGHSQTSLTLNTYSHVIPSLQSDAAKLMDAMFEAR